MYHHPSQKFGFLRYGSTTDPHDLIYCHATLNRIGTAKSLPALRSNLKSFLKAFTSMAIKVVFFDVGETLFSEARLWAGWADYFGVEQEDFRRALQETIARGEHHRRVFDAFRTGFDIEAARRERAARGDRDVLQARDLYPDAVPCLKRLRGLGYLVGIAGNQSAEWEAVLRQLDLGLIGEPRCAEALATVLRGFGEIGQRVRCRDRLCW